MGFIEILLIIIGILAFVGSFIIPEKMSKTANVEISEEKINQLIEEQVKKASFKIEEKVDETISAAAEKTERYMERMSNEKVMAIQEFSDTVLGQINKNHEESVFLYDMLNNKYAQVKNTTAEINARVQEWKDDTATIAVVENDAATETVVSEVETKAVVSDGEDKAKVKKPATKRKPPVKKTALKNTGSNAKAIEAIPNIEIQFDSDSNMGSNKEKILSLHQEGKSNMAIAKSLGLGIGEVKLIIDLFESGE